MKLFSNYKGKKWIGLSLSAAVAFTAAAVRNVPSLEVWATNEQSSKSSEPAEEVVPANPAYSLEKGEYKLYKWSRVMDGDYKNLKDKQEKLSLFVTAYYPGEDRDSVDIKHTWHYILCPLAPGDVWLGKDYDYDLSGEVHRGKDPDCGGFHRADTAQSHSAWLKADKIVESDEWIEIQTENGKRNSFYTPDSRNGVYVSYTGDDSNNSDYTVFDGNMRAGVFNIRLSDNDGSHDYYLGGGTYWNAGVEGELYVSNGNNVGNKPVITQTEDGPRGDGSDYDERTNPDKWKIYFGGENFLFCTNTGYWANMQNENEEGFDLLWYVATEERYAAVKDNIKLKNQVLSLGASQYISGNGSAEGQNGVFINPEKSITVGEGAILSVDGNLINNGSIIVDKGGTLIIKNGGTISPFMASGATAKNGCGVVKCLGGDIIIQQGGALYAGLSDENGSTVPFYLDHGSTLINQGLLVYGSMRISSSVRIELQETSKTYGGYCQFDNQIMTGKYTSKAEKDAGITKWRKQGYTPTEAEPKVVDFSDTTWVIETTVENSQEKKESKEYTIEKQTTEYYVTFEKRKRIKNVTMFHNFNQTFLDKNPGGCSVLKKASSFEGITGGMGYGMYSDDKERTYVLKVSTSEDCVFDDDFVNKYGQVDKRELKL